MSAAIRVLHVDDEPDFGDLTATVLERSDERFEVDTRTSAAAGLDRLAEGDFDCVVSDYQMPATDGLEFLEAVREENPDLPFLLFTGQGSEEVASEAITAGATDYLQKESGTEHSNCWPTGSPTPSTSIAPVGGRPTWSGFEPSPPT